jgi:hypothetical protein
MKNPLAGRTLTGTIDCQSLTKREHVAIEAMAALIKVYDTKSGGQHKDPNFIKRVAYEYADAMLQQEPPLAE